jgi:hypothetical protein
VRILNLHLLELDIYHFFLFQSVGIFATNSEPFVRWQRDWEFQKQGEQVGATFSQVVKILTGSVNIFLRFSSFISFIFSQPLIERFSAS